MDHPSAAFLLYVATIEGIGARWVELSRCERCGAETGAGRRFRAALERVLPADDVKALNRDAYPRRSTTGHSGTLHGTEDTFGYGGFSLFQWDDRDLFDYALVWPIRNACRKVVREIIRELRHEE